MGTSGVTKSLSRPYKCRGQYKTALSSVFISRLKYIVCLSGVIVHESKDFQSFCLCFRKQGHPTSIFGKYLFGRRFEI